VVNRYQYDAFGNTVEAVENVKNRFRYAGEQFDQVTGQYYLRARFYNPVVGRFTQEDTYRGDGLNLYAYVSNNPIKYYDPSGYSCETKSNVYGPTLEEAADLAAHIYSGNKGDVRPGGWELVEVYDPGSLRMGVYARERDDGTTEYAIVNKGTTPSKFGDWMNNVQQPFGASKDMRNSIEFSREFVKNHRDANITFIGHSKGGAEAAANALATKKDAILFNPASLNPSAYGLKPEEYTGNMTAYIVKGDILNTIFGPISKPIDKVEYLPRQSWNPITNHLMDAVKEAIK